MPNTPDHTDGTRSLPARDTRRGVVTTVHPHTTPDDNSNYEVDVRLVDGEEGVDTSESGATYQRVPVEVSTQGEVRGIENGQLVNVSFYEDNSERPYVSGVAYSLESRAPLAHEGDWRERHDESVFETIRLDDGGRLVRIGHQPEDRDDLDSGIVFDTSDGAFELYDSEGNGLCCDGDGNVVLSNSGEVGGSLTGSAVESDPPVDTSSNSSSGTEESSIRPDTADSTNLGAAGYAPTPSAQSLSADADSDTTDLEAQGISEGDEIDPYLEEFFESGQTVYIPPGSYVWNGGGLSGTYSDAELIGGIEPGSLGRDEQLPDNQAQTTLTRADGWSGSATITCDGGAVQIRNLTISGANGPDPALRLDVTHPAATMVIDSLHLPDGDTTDATDPGVVVEPSHAGTLHARNWFVEDFRYGGIHAAGPGQPSNGGRRGRTIVAGGLYRDNNISNIRIGGMGSAVREVTSIQTSAATTTGSTHNPRALWLSDWVDCRVSDSDIIYQDAEGPAVVLGAGADADGVSRGFLDGNRIRNDHTDPIINVFDGEWTGSANHFTGTGNLTPTGGDFVGTCSGGGCDPPNSIPRHLSDG